MARHPESGALRALQPGGGPGRLDARRLQPRGGQGGPAAGRDQRVECRDKCVVERRAVSAGEVTTGGIRINEGLHPGDRVITGGVSEIHARQKVRLAAASP